MTPTSHTESEQRPKVLLLGGTSETAPLALQLVDAGYQVIVSTATDAQLAVGDHPAISRRCGRLNADDMAQLVEQQAVFAVVDATHPYATEVHQVARQVAAACQRSYLRYQRQGLLDQHQGWVGVKDHQQAAQRACAEGKPILLTTGSRHLDPYVAEATRCNIPLFARVLNHPESLAACDAAKLQPASRILGRGPFSLEQNRELIRQHHIGVVVTKDSGNAGGVLEKLTAAQSENCLLIVVQRPEEDDRHRFSDMTTLITALTEQLMGDEVR